MATKITNKKTDDTYISQINTDTKNWLKLMYEENPEFFDRNELKDLYFMPLN